MDDGTYDDDDQVYDKQWVSFIVPLSFTPLCCSTDRHAQPSVSACAGTLRSLDKNQQSSALKAEPFLLWEGFRKGRRTKMTG